MRRQLVAALTFFLGCGPTPAGSVDAGEPDSGVNAAVDSGMPDAAVELDAGTPDAGASDAGVPDSGMPANDAGAPDAGRRQPPPLPTYAGTCPTLVAGPTQATGRNLNFTSAGDSRELVP